MILSILAAVTCLVAIVFWRATPRRQVKRWRKALALDKHGKAFNELYSSVDGFLLSKAARKTNDAMEYVYGEIEFEPFIALLSLCKPNEKTCFYDLGSGTGKAVLACAMVFSVNKSCGIELFPTLHQCAKQQQHRLSLLNDYHEKAKQIKFKQSNFLDISLSDATIIFINATAFFGEYWLQISKHLEQIKPGMLVISTSKALKSDHFFIKTTAPVAMSWGVVEAYIQERRPYNHGQSQ